MSQFAVAKPRCRTRVRRLTIFVLTVSLGTVALLLGFSAWVVAVTMPVMVVDGDGKVAIEDSYPCWDDVVRLYPVHDLLTGRGDDLLDQADELRDLVRANASPNSWDSVGGTGEIFVSARTRTMVVSQTPPAHESIQRLLTYLRTGKDPAARQEDQRIHQALNQPVSFTFRGEPLSVAVLELEDLGGIPRIELDKPALEEEGVVPETPVNFQVRDMPLRSALRLLLGGLNLTVVVDGGVLRITSQLNAGFELDVCVYPISDLVGDPPDPDMLIEVLEQTVALYSWSTFGGPGTASFFTPRASLVITQTQANRTTVCNAPQRWQGSGDRCGTPDSSRQAHAGQLRLRRDAAGRYVPHS